MSDPMLCDTAILIGYNTDGVCVYSEIISFGDYYDGEHIWDKVEPIRRLKLKTIKGYLFNSDGVLDQDFISVFDVETGVYDSGHTKFADGTERYD